MRKFFLQRWLLTAIPWRMGVEEYCTASGTVPLALQPFTAGGSSELPDAIRACGSDVFDAQVILTLLADLGSRFRGGS